MKRVWRLYRYSHQLPLIDESYHHMICTFRCEGDMKLILGLGTSALLALSAACDSAMEKLELSPDERDVLFKFLYEHFGNPHLDDGSADEDVPF